MGRAIPLRDEEGERDYFTLNVKLNVQHTLYIWHRLCRILFYENNK